MIITFLRKTQNENKTHYCTVSNSHLLCCTFPHQAYQYNSGLIQYFCRKFCLLCCNVVLKMYRQYLKFCCVPEWSWTLITVLSWMRNDCILCWLPKSLGNIHVSFTTTIYYPFGFEIYFAGRNKKQLIEFVFNNLQQSKTYVLNNTIYSLFNIHIYTGVSYVNTISTKAMSKGGVVHQGLHPQKENTRKYKKIEDNISSIA